MSLQQTDFMTDAVVAYAFGFLVGLTVAYFAADSFSYEFFQTPFVLGSGFGAGTLLYRARAASGDPDASES